MLVALQVLVVSRAANAQDAPPPEVRPSVPAPHKQGLWGELGLLTLSTFSKLVRPGVGLFLAGAYRWDRWSAVVGARGAVGPTRYVAFHLGGEANVLRRGFTPWLGLGLGWSMTRFDGDRSPGGSDTYGNAGLTATGAVGITTGTSYPVRIAFRVNLPFYAEKQSKVSVNGAALTSSSGPAPRAFLSPKTHRFVGDDGYPDYAPTFELDLSYAFYAF